MFTNQHIILQMKAKMGNIFNNHTIKKDCFLKSGRFSKVCEYPVVQATRKFMKMREMD